MYFLNAYGGYPAIAMIIEPYRNSGRTIVAISPLDQLHGIAEKGKEVMPVTLDESGTKKSRLLSPPNRPI
ncbi:MAG TPA: hypothetical protein DIT95_19250 [Arenibacter sp.]|nr:hypothetical protein [Arenibacter sp.]